MRSLFRGSWAISIVLTGPSFAVPLAHAQIPHGPKIDGLIKQLASKNYKERDEADRQLRTMPKAVPYLKAALSSSDPEVVERITKILALYKSYSPKLLQRAKEFAKAGKVDLAIEQLWALDPPPDDKKYWQTIVDIAWLVGDKAIQGNPNRVDLSHHLPPRSLDDFEKNRLEPPPMTKITPRALADYQKANQGKWISLNAPFQEMREVFLGCLRAEAVNCQYLNHSVLIAPKNVAVHNTMANSILLVNGTFSGRKMVARSILIVGDQCGQLDHIHDSIVIADGPIPRIIQIKNSIIIASGNNVHNSPITRQSSDKWILKDKEQKPLGFIKWFETAQIGIEAKLAENSIEISALGQEKAFAKAGCRLGDKVLGVDQSRIDSVEEFRTSLRRAVVKGKVSLTLVRGKKRMEVTVVLTE